MEKTSQKNILSNLCIEARKFIADSYNFEIGGDGYILIYQCPKCRVPRSFTGGMSSYVPRCPKDDEEMVEVKKEYQCPRCGGKFPLDDITSVPPRCPKDDEEMVEVKRR